MATAITLCPVSAWANETHQDDLVVTVAPYGWVPTVTGMTALGPLKVPVRVTPKDFAQGLKIGFMGYARLDSKRHFVYAETILADYDNKNFVPFFGQSLTSKIRFVEGGVGLNLNIAVGRNHKLKISPYLGVQHLYIGSFITGNLITATANGNWTNPTAGFFFDLPVSKWWSIIGKVDAAGFGLGKTDYRSAQASLDYHISKRVTLNAGYRIAKGKFGSPTGLDLDLEGSGPVVGLRWLIPVRQQQ